jgi:hypothetical protein
MAHPRGNVRTTAGVDRAGPGRHIQHAARRDHRLAHRISGDATTMMTTLRAGARAAALAGALAAALAAASAGAAPLGAQITAPRALPLEPEPGSELVVYLMTMGEGDLVWERFGHNAIWIHDPATRTDHTYNWGLFDFDQPGFLRRFIQGRMWYWMDAFDAHRTADAYVRHNRSVWVQELELTPSQKRDLAEYLEWHRLPENRFYRYDYYYDNCSTRVRDALDRVLGGQIARQTMDAPAGATLRSHTRRVTTIEPVTYTGLLIGLGQPVDRPISIWEEMFLPLSMRESVRDLTVIDDQGRERPLVRAERTLFTADRPPLPDAPPRWWPAYLLLGLAIAGAALALGHFAPRSRGARAALATLGGAWMLIAGILGILLAFLWGFTDHAAAYRNENLFQFNPLALPLAALFPSLLYRPRRAPGLTTALAAAVAGIAVLGLLLQPLPWFSQVNGEIIALALPVHLAIAATAWRTARAPRHTHDRPAHPGRTRSTTREY